MLNEIQAQLAREVAPLIHNQQFRIAAKMVVDAFQLDIKVNSGQPKDYLPPLQAWLNFLLAGGHMVEAAQLLWSPSQFNPEPQFTKSVWNLFDKTSTGLIMGAASCSKCLSPNDLCRMFDGSSKRAGDIQIGDELSGGDEVPRVVVDRHDGEAEMFDILGVRGEPLFRCNGDHILTLICSWTKRNHGGRCGVSSGYTPGTVVDVSVRDYLGWSNQKKRAHRLFLKTAPMPSQPVAVDPYVYGSWLGDGTRIRCELTSPAGPMTQKWALFWESKGFRVVQWTPLTLSVRGEQDGDYIWPNKWVRESVVGGEKRIRPEYLRNSEEVRLQLLAGLIDSDGTAIHGGFDVVSKWKSLADDIAQLAESLGFIVKQATRIHTIKDRNFSADYHHCRISGAVNRIPVLETKTKKSSTRGETSGFSTLGFSVKSAGAGKYAGFGVTGDHRFLLKNGIVTHNSYGMGVRLFLEWLRDPLWTTIRLIGPSEDHLETNLFSHLVSLHEQASLPLPGEIGSLFIGLNRRNLVSSIKGLVIPVGKVKKAGRLQGTKRKPRQTPHPIFGELSRLFVFLDEIENVPAGVWSDIDNVLSNLDQVDSAGLKIFGAYNPTSQADEVGTRAEPPFGWKDFDVDKHYEWISKRGWNVLRLDGEKSENVVQHKIIYPGLQSEAGLARIATNAGGIHSAGYLSMGRGAYPQHSVESTVVSPSIIAKARGEFIWMEKPSMVGSADLALEGGAKAIFSHGQFGQASGIKFPPSLEFPAGRTIIFKTRSGIFVPRYGLQLNQQVALPRGDTVATAGSLTELAKQLGIRPEMLCVDRTGNGAGVHDLMKTNWSTLIQGVNYSSGPTTMKIMEEDTKTAAEEFDRIDSELQFALAAWLEFQVLLIHPAVDMTQLTDQMTNRRFRVVAGKRKVESKKDYKMRLAKESPDEEDSLTLFVHAARQGRQLVPSMGGDGNPGFNPGDDEWWDGAMLENGTRFDAASTVDTLEV